MAGERKGRIVDSFQGVNGHTGIPKSRRMKPRQSFFRWLLSTGTWLLTWYSIITVIFQCPESPELITESSPHICKPYFKVKSSLVPYASPYYEKYAAPYVDSARPYYNVLDKNVITPVVFYGKKYGAPRVAQAQAIGREQWERQIQPQVAMLNQLAHQQYNKTLAPHVQTAVAATMPYAKFAKENALQTYYTAVLPAYAAVEPYAQHAYEIGKSFTVNVGIPYVQWAWASGVIFLDRTIWPKAKILYGENVEPQLIRIGERLGRYRDGKKLKSSVDVVSVSSTTSVFSSISSEVPTVATPDVSVTTSTPTASSTSSAPSEESSPVPLSADEERANAQKIVAEDLKTWQEKFAKAADKGSDELDQRIAEITDRAIHKQVQGVGEAHLIVLEETVKSQIKSFKAAIISIVKLQGGEGDVNAATRKAGLAIRDKAQAVRTWRRSFDQETNELISMASEDTFQIIDHIRDLGLQEIGMRWAWTDGITHKDWAKYHALKNKFDEWRHDVEDVITGHPGVEDSRAASEDIENRAMAIAEDAAKELARLKETGKWKLAMGDASDDFSTQRLPAPAAAVKQKVVEKAREASETVGGYVQDSASASSVAENIKAYASEVSESVADAASSVSSSVVGSSQGAAESLVSAAQASLGSLVEKASNAVVGTSQGTLESAGSIVGDSASSILENASSSAGEVFDAALSTVSSAFGAVKNADPSSEVVTTSITPPKATGSEASIPNEQESYSEKLQNVAAEAGEQLADVTNAVSEALQQTKGKGIAEGATSIAADQYSSALSAASVALHGTEQDAGESIASVASDKYADAVSAASSVIYDTPTPSIDLVIAQASSAYDDAVRQAQERMTRASSVVSAMVSGTPKPIHENMFSSVRAAYSDSVAAASSRLEAAISAATEVVNAASEGVEDFATSVSSAAGSSATSVKDEL